MSAVLTSLTLSHFRSHRRAELRFGGGPVVIIGANGAGKTNLIEAISLLSPGRGLRGAAAAELARRPEGIGWRVTAGFAARGGGAGHEIELRADPEAPRSCRIDGKPAPQAALGRICRAIWLVPAMDRLWIEGADGRRRFLDRLTLSVFPDHAEAAVTYERAMRARNRLLREDSRDGRWFAALEAQMGEAGAALLARRAEALARVRAAQVAAPGPFPAAELELVAPQGQASEGIALPLPAAALAERIAASRSADLAAGRTLVGPHRADLAATYAAKAMPAAQCSTGEQKALLISVVLAHARALADGGGPPLLLLDEVAAHLDGARRAALFDALCALGAQAFLTGTDAALFEAMGGRAQWVSVTEGPGGSTIAERPAAGGPPAAAPPDRGADDGQ